MDEGVVDKKPMHFLKSTKRFLLVSLLTVAGLLLTLAGMNLISITANLQLYSGVGLLALAMVYYFIY